MVHPDHLNTPRLVADATGTTVWRWDQQEPFGNNPAEENPSGLGAFDPPLRLPGQRYDQETGLHYNYFRDYDASLGIYKQSDPSGLSGGLATYVYGDQDPLRKVDPAGLKPYNFRITVGGGVSWYALMGQVFNLEVSDPIAGQTWHLSLPLPAVDHAHRQVVK